MEKRGITLIALVITIIVLLILAGITISLTIGNQGVITRAQQASKNYKEAEGKEKEELDNFDTEVENIINGMAVEGDEGTLEIGEAINSSDYGKIVTNYTVSYECGKNLDKTSSTWRLFYQDKENTYLIADELVGNYSLDEEYEKEPNKYKNGGSVGEVGRSLNPMLKDAYTKKESGYKFFDDINEEENMLGVAWLTDTSKWDKYIKGTDAEYAIGSPTIELLVKSYNAVAEKNGRETIELTLEDHGYVGAYSDSKKENFFKSSYNGGIYNKPGIYDAEEEKSNWWLASPRGGYIYGGNYGRYASVLQGYYAGEETGGVIFDSLLGENAVRPIVCIKTSTFKNKYTLGGL